ncbi:MAG TPA: hypothetical protein VKZ56_09255 [Membranihabitans sp.]|nr:hypothetical protein [Membranihabitans sp.]
MVYRKFQDRRELFNFVYQKGKRNNGVVWLSEGITTDQIRTCILTNIGISWNLFWKGNLLPQRMTYSSPCESITNFTRHFFSRSFGYELLDGLEFFYLVSPHTNENTSRDITIFFAVLCSELDKDGRNFLEDLRHSEFSLEEIQEYFKNTSRAEIIRANKQLSSVESLQRFMNTLVKRNIAIRMGNEVYSFTLAHKFFIDFARDLLE